MAQDPRHEQYDRMIKEHHAKDKKPTGAIGYEPHYFAPGALENAIKNAAPQIQNDIAARGAINADNEARRRAAEAAKPFDAKAHNAMLGEDPTPPPTPHSTKHGKGEGRPR